MRTLWLGRVYHQKAYRPVRQLPGMFVYGGFVMVESFVVLAVIGLTIWRAVYYIQLARKNGGLRFRPRRP